MSGNSSGRFSGRNPPRSSGQRQGGGNRPANRDNRDNRDNRGGRQNFRHRRRRHHGSSRLQSMDKVVSKYQNLLEQHNIARRKYFEWYNRADNNQRTRFENLYYSTLEELRRFERNLSPYQREHLYLRLDPNPPDRIYSSNHELPIAGPPPPNGPYPDPHLLPQQKETIFSNDREESMGTMEDYVKLKGGTGK